jgi:hypothetical protein
MSTAPWPCEERVVALVVSYLEQEGWDIGSIAHTESRARGADIRATKGAELLIVEAKGFPGTVYARGVNQGKPKPTKPGVQARHWFGQVLFDCILRQSEYPDSHVVMALPDFPVYRNLLRRTKDALRKLEIGVYFVGEDGSVHLSLEED